MDGNSLDRSSKDERYLLTAEAIGAIWSKDPSSKVGCIAVGDLITEAAWGYKGFSPGVEDSDELLNDREKKYALIVHAEENAMENALFTVRLIYVSRHPCARCAQKIVDLGTIVRVVYRQHADFDARWAVSLKIAARILADAGINLIALPESVQR